MLHKKAYFNYAPDQGAYLFLDPLVCNMHALLPVGSYYLAPSILSQPILTPLTKILKQTLTFWLCIVRITRHLQPPTSVQARSRVSENGSAYFQYVVTVRI